VASANDFFKYYTFFICLAEPLGRTVDRANSVFDVMIESASFFVRNIAPGFPVI